MNREELLYKLNQKIKNKRNNVQTTNPQHMAKLGKEFKKKITEINKDTRITNEMKEKYKLAITKFPNNNIVNPKILLDDSEKYKKEYSKYILSSIKTAKEKKLSMETVNTMIDNEYTQYMCCVLNLPIKPF
jgi:hypothetical protein